VSCSGGGHGRDSGAVSGDPAHVHGPAGHADHKASADSADSQAVLGGEGGECTREFSCLHRQDFGVP